ncbi:D-alanyl-D-alanine-carboxypeptidase/endopeptidaseAmpH precursor [Serratia fonticola]|uniref:D-alanyl-D-alanine-carboxypeptidase/endopeptidase AmpH n=1 Tax=Serratia fonticola TaxID=47917 RepID=A0A4U9URI0_SERFO|nr:D-alanyl-D-alanine-carboxypeptidase/endopeptidaseAmpH precursor [Serratia fonticola]
MAPKDGLPGIIQKTGGGGGFITYMAMVPQQNIGVFVVVTRSELDQVHQYERSGQPAGRGFGGQQRLTRSWLR